MLRRFAAVMASLVLLPFADLCAQEVQAPRPVVGIALSGGGALGLAHIGVLRYFEEHRIPIDRIAGTSMGGLIGGFYATGHDPAEMEQLIRTMDWDDLLRATPRFEDRSIAEKQDWNRITGQYTLRFRESFELPAGLNSGQSLILLLSRQTAEYWDVRNFDNLPIPFRCVATDLFSGEPFVLGEGLLPKALRATMAIPGIFTPVDWEGRFLSDGALVNNLPTDVVKNMGANVIVGVTLRVEPSTVNELDNLANILRQSVNIAIIQNELRNLPIADIEISVDLGNRTSMDFTDTAAIVARGYQAAAQKAAALERLSLSPQQWDEYLRVRRARERTAPVEGPIVDVTTPNPTIESDATHELLRKTDSSVSQVELEATLRGLMAATGLPNAYYGWHRVNDQSGYEVEFEPRRNTEIHFRPSLFYQLSSEEPSRPTLRLSTATILKDAYKSRFLADFFIGDNPASVLEYYHPFNGSAYFVAPGLSLARDRYPIYDGSELRDETRDRVAASLYFGVGTWRHVQLRLGLQAGLDRYSRFVSGVASPSLRAKFLSPEIRGIVNTQDSGQLPTRGLRLNGVGGWSFRDNPFPYFQLSFDHFHPLGNNVSLFATGRMDTSFSRPLGFYDQFAIGGFTELDAYRYQEFRGDTIFGAGGGLFYRGVNPNMDSYRPLFGFWHEAARVSQVAVEAQVKNSSTIGVFIPTDLGLVGLTFSHDLKSSARFRLSIGSFWNHP